VGVIGAATNGASTSGVNTAGKRGVSTNGGNITVPIAFTTRRAITSLPDMRIRPQGMSTRRPRLSIRRLRR